MRGTYYSHHPHFVDGETEAGSGKALAQCHTAVPGRAGIQASAVRLPGLCSKALHLRLSQAPEHSAVWMDPGVFNETSERHHWVVSISCWCQPCREHLDRPHATQHWGRRGVHSQKGLARLRTSSRRAQSHSLTGLGGRGAADA